MKKQTIWSGVMISVIYLLFIPFHVSDGQPYTCPWPCTFPTNTGYGFRGRWIYENPPGTPVSFYNNDFYIPVKIHYNIYNKNASFPLAVENAANKWNNLYDSYFNIEILKSGINYDYSYINTYIIDGYDGVNLIGFDQGNEFVDPNSTDSKEKLAYSHIFMRDEEYYDPGTNLYYSCRYWYSPRIKEVDININPYLPLALNSVADPDYYDFTTVIAHEFGHLAGLRHFTGPPSATGMMQPKVKKGAIERSLTSDDRLALRTLYGGCDNGQISYVPCNEFTAGQEFLTAEEDGGDVPGCDICDPDCGCRTSALQLAHISDNAYKNIIIFGMDSCHWKINKLRKRIVENEGELIAIADTTDPQYKSVQMAMRNCINVNAALLDGTFSCYPLINDSSLILHTKNIQACIVLIDQILKLSVSNELKTELSALKEKLPLYEGLNIREAAILYDKSEFE